MASRLIVLSEPLRGQSFDLTDDVYTIGRSEDQAICVPDVTLSGRHCELVRNEEGRYTARDLGSTNGTRINGVRIAEQELQESDILQVGAVEILFETESSRQSSPVSNTFDATHQVNATRIPFDSSRPALGYRRILLVAGILIAVLALVVGGVRWLSQLIPDLPRYAFVALSASLGLLVVAVAVVLLVHWLRSRPRVGSTPGGPGSAADRKDGSDAREESLYRDLIDDLETNSVTLTPPIPDGLAQSLTSAGSPLVGELRQRFHRVVVIDCAAAASDGVVDWDSLAAMIYRAMLDAYGITGAGEEFHIEDISQLLKDEPRSLFCFLNTQLLTDDHLSNLREFTQTHHRTLFVCH